MTQRRKDPGSYFLRLLYECEFAQRPQYQTTAPSTVTGTICSRTPRRPQRAHEYVFPMGVASRCSPRVQKYAMMRIATSTTKGAHAKNSAIVWDEIMRIEGFAHPTSLFLESAGCPASPDAPEAPRNRWQKNVHVFLPLDALFRENQVLKSTSCRARKSCTFR